MPKILFIFSGTAVTAQKTHHYCEVDAFSKEAFNPNVVRVYFSGCQDKRIGGKTYLQGLINPDLDVVANKIHRCFSTSESGVRLKLSDLKQAFGDALIIEPKEALNQEVIVDDITLNGFSRGAVTTFAVAQKLDPLGVPISVFAEEPVPGNSRVSSTSGESLYAKYADLRSCRNLVRGEVILGTYSKHNKPWENKWFRQMAPQFNSETESHLYLISKKFHTDTAFGPLQHFSTILFNTGFTSIEQKWPINHDRIYLIPKVEQQKFHAGIMGRTEYLPLFKRRIFNELMGFYKDKGPCPINEASSFKSGQALRILHVTVLHATGFNYRTLFTNVLETGDKAKCLREFIVELDGIIRYSAKEMTTLVPLQLLAMDVLEARLFQHVEQFYAIEHPTLKDKKDFEHNIQLEIQAVKGRIPNKAYEKLLSLTTLFLRENTLTHPHLGEYITETETFASNPQTAHNQALDGVCHNVRELARKLYNSSQKQREAWYEKEHELWSALTSDAGELGRLAQFISPKQLRRFLQEPKTDEESLVQVVIRSMNDVLVIMEILPSEEHRREFYRAIRDFLPSLEPTEDDLAHFKEYLPANEYEILYRASQNRSTFFQSASKPFPARPESQPAPEETPKQGVDVK